MSINAHNKYKTIIKSCQQNSSIEEWYLKSCISNDESSNLNYFLTSLEQIKCSTEDTISIPILSNQIFKGIFKKQSGNSSMYNSFTLRQYQNDGIKMIKEFKSNDQRLEIVQLTDIYTIIDDVIDDLKMLDNEKNHQRDFNAIKDMLYSINTKVDKIIELFANKDNHGISLSLDKHLNIEIYLKKDSMVIRFKLKDSATTIGYINDPFLINLYAKMMHMHDSVCKIIYNLDQIR